MKASIIIINFNDKLRVQRAIESALDQSWNDVEVIVVDDGSDQETRDIYNKYDVKLVQLEREDNTKRTPSGARNAGIKAATGDRICFLDSDNYYQKDFITECMKCDSDVMFVNWEIVGHQNYKVDIEKVWDMNNGILQNYLKFTHLDHQCLLIKKDYLFKVGFYDCRLPRSQDCDMIVRLILQGGSWGHINKKLFVFEKHEEDQMKSYASIHGKTLWTLKNNINIQWLLGLCNDPMKMMAVWQGIMDYMNNPEWRGDFDNSEFKKLYDESISKIYSERKEKVLV